MAWTELRPERCGGGYAPDARRNSVVPGDRAAATRTASARGAGAASRPKVIGPEARRAAEATSALQRSAPLGGLRLAWRNWVLRLIERLYWAGTLAGTLLMLACGGIVPVMRAWLRNEVDDWSGVVACLGGLWFRVETLDPDSDLGPVLARVDAPQLFATIESVGRRLGVKPPGQVRLTYLPCCGVVAWGGSRR